MIYPAAWLIRHFLEKLSCDTWERLGHARRLQISQGEETITDINLLELERLATWLRSSGAGLGAMYVTKCPKHLEARSGIDWDWFIGHPDLGWYRFAVQAKRINPRGTGRYDKFSHKVINNLTVTKEEQVDILQRFAVGERATAIYCLYNHTQIWDAQPYWHCCQENRIEPHQLGCTITPASTIKWAMLTHGKRTFKAIHARSETLPWRCLTCSTILPNLSARAVFPRGTRAGEPNLENEPTPYAGPDNFHSELPESLRIAREGERTISQATLYRELYEDAPSFPRRIAIFEI